MNELYSKYQSLLLRLPHKVVVLDDDPTGVQTVHGIFVYTDWSIESIRDGFLSPQKVFYILTNSRAFTGTETRRVHQEIAKRLLLVSAETGLDFILISRGDSTLRGHYPLETDVLASTLSEGGQRLDGEFLILFFGEGKRFTRDDIHYVEIDGERIPAGETEFAKDRTFGYQNSDLKYYIEEKTKGLYPAGKVVSFSLKLLREQPEEVFSLLQRSGQGQRFIVNSESEEDLVRFCIPLYRAILSGRRFLFRTAASFVRVFSGIAKRPLLTTAELFTDPGRGGGLIVAGSHTARTTGQLLQLRSLAGLSEIEFAADAGEREALAAEGERVRKLAEQELAGGKTVLIYTSRRLCIDPLEGEEAALKRSLLISEALTGAVLGIRVKPRYVLAKGGITSSDIGLKALKVKKALVLGQIRPGVPVWRTGPESRFPGIPYVIFPGNVGGEETLREAVRILEGEADERI